MSLIPNRCIGVQENILAAPIVGVCEEISQRVGLVAKKGDQTKDILIMR